MTLGQFLGRFTRRPAEQAVKPIVRHAQAGRVVEIAEVEAERAILFEIDDLVENRLRESRLSVRREPHHLVFAGVHTEAEVVGERAVQQSERMREVYLAQQLDGVPSAVRQ